MSATTAELIPKPNSVQWYAGEQRFISSIRDAPNTPAIQLTDYLQRIS